MILLLDTDMTLHVRWEGARFYGHHPLTPRAAQRLIQEVLGYMSQYRRELKVFSRFIEQVGEEPFDDPRAGVDTEPVREEELPSASRVEEDRTIEIGAEVEI